METVLFLLAIGIGVFYFFHRSGKPDFWRLVRKHPDLAMEWFRSEACWVIVPPGEPAPTGSKYTPGFTVFDPATNQWVKVYGIHDQIEDSEDRFIVKCRSSIS